MIYRYHRFLVTLAIWFIIGIALCLTGCAEKYVPVVVKDPLPKPPAECSIRDQALPRMKPFPALTDDVAWSALCPGVLSKTVCVNAVWAKHSVAVTATTRRNVDRHSVCARFATSLGG